MRIRGTDRIILHKGKEYVIQGCHNKPVTIYEFGNYIEFQCQDRCKKVYVHGYDLLTAYPFWNVTVNGNLLGIIEIKGFSNQI